MFVYVNSEKITPVHIHTTVWIQARLSQIAHNSFIYVIYMNKQ